MNTATASFNTITRQMTDMSQQKKEIQVATPLRAILKNATQHLVHGLVS